MLIEQIIEFELMRSGLPGRAFKGWSKKSFLFCFSSSFLLKQLIMKIFSPNNSSMMGNYVLQF